MLQTRRQMIFQNSASSLNQKMKVVDIITEPMKIQHMTPKRGTLRKEAVFQMEYVGLEQSFLDRYPTELSGGQRQRLAICQAVMGEKKLLIFDEPTSGLDFRHMCQVEKLMKQLSEEKYIIIVVTHDYEFLNRACKRYIRINS